MSHSELAIQDIQAWEALDSRGDPTVACRVTLAGGGVGRAIVPAGASKGRHEAREWRDGGTRMSGRGVRGAVDMIRTHIKPALIGVEAADLESVDRVLWTIPAPPDRGYLGSNTTLAVSVAAARAGAAGRGVALWRHIEPTGPPALPMPMTQILAGGAHADHVIDLQDVLVMPTGATTFADAIEMVWRVRASAMAAAQNAGHAVQLVGDEGGLAIRFGTNRGAVEFVARAIHQAKLDGDVWIAIDVAAGQLVDRDGCYRLTIEDRTLDRDAWLEELRKWVRDLPLRSIEDPIDDDDWEGWHHALEALGGVQLIGDDLFATDRNRLERGIQVGAANAILVKPNQRGSLSEAAEVVRMASANGIGSIVSARSGDSEDDWLADIAVGWRARQIKVGALARSERTAKWNRLLELEAVAGGSLMRWPRLIGSP